MAKTIKTAFVQILLILGLIFVTMGNHQPLRGNVFSPEPAFADQPSGYTEYEQALETSKLARHGKLGRRDNGYRFGPMGVDDVAFDTTAWHEVSAPRVVKKSVFTIYGLYIKEHSELNNAIYAVEKGQPYLLKDDQRRVLPFYLDVVGQQRNKQELAIDLMLPVNKTTRLLLIAAWVLSLVVGLFCVVSIFFGGLIRFIQEIAKGRAFSEVNIQILKNICYVSLGIPLLYLIANLLLWLYVQIVFPGNFGLDPQLYFITARFLLIGVFFLALFHAFKKGYVMQQENEFTV